MLDIKVDENMDFDWNNWSDDDDVGKENILSKIRRSFLLFKREQFWFDKDYFDGVDWDYIIDNVNVIDSVNGSKIGKFLANVRNSIDNVFADTPFTLILRQVNFTKKDNKMLMNVAFSIFTDNQEQKLEESFEV